MKYSLAFLVVALAASEASANEAERQFARCEMDAIKNMEWQQGDWYGPAGRYLYACMRAAGFDLVSHRTPEEGHCTFGDMRRIVLPECYKARP
ncbi:MULTISPECIES: hypothetical protein [unclassified Bradyrhizobium]|uniref:hypothetical protein n=1 Tax=unclassified Bradyrhizobium TaxID=2631580 RepID=UPI0029167FDD|nr:MULTISPECIES: hypothetical protein [unclassified Bradyrhizobium]